MEERELLGGCWAIKSHPHQRWQGDVPAPRARSVFTLAGRGSEHACWSLEALIKSRLYQKSTRNFQRAEETESSRSKEAPGRVFGAGRDVAFSEGIVLGRQPG